MELDCFIYMHSFYFFIDSSPYLLSFPEVKILL